MEGGGCAVCMDEADCVCVSEATVFGEDETEAVSLRIRPARLASSRLPGSLKLFDDRTGHITAGGGGEGRAGGGGGGGAAVGGVWKLVICIQLFLSSCGAPFLLPPLYLFLYFLCYCHVAVASLFHKDAFKLFMLLSGAHACSQTSWRRQQEAEIILKVSHTIGIIKIKRELL